jgi:DNA-binding NarL/FixJ family response regulator
MEVTGAPRTTISRHLDKYGHLEFLGSRKSGRSKAHEHLDTVAELKGRGLSMHEIGRRVGLSYGAVRRIVRDMEVAR